MGKQFHIKDTNWRLFAPSRLQALATPPGMIRRDVFGRVELCIGRLGAGKTTWGSLRAKRLAKKTGAVATVDELGRIDWEADGSNRRLVTTGEAWPDPWESVASWEELFEVTNAVVLLDEVHLLAPSTRGLLDASTEKLFVRWLSLCRKRHVCTIGTTQAWTRVATHYRQLVGQVWICTPVNPGKLHRATAHDIPEEGGAEAWAPQWFNPASAEIPTNSAVWVPGADEELAAAPKRSANRGTAPKSLTVPPFAR
jgi:hypothetical protein